MAVGFNSATSTNGNASSFTFSHSPAGNDRILLVYVAYKNSADVTTSVVFNGSESLTELEMGVHGSVQVGSLWYLEDPTETTANVVVTLSVTEKAAIGAVSYSGVDHIELTNSTTLTGQSTNVSGTITTVGTDSCVVEAMSVRDRGTGFTNDPAYNFRYTDNSTGNPANGTAFSRGYDIEVATSGTTQTSATTIDSVEAWVVNTAELIPAAAGQENNFGFIM